MQIDFLVNHPQHLPAVAAWHYAMWGHLSANASVAKKMADLAKHVGQPAIPTTLVALDGESVLGSASLVENDLRTHPYLNPFLASVYVGEEYRRRGVASALVQRVMVEAATLGVKKLYLITPDQQRLYGRLGWTAEEEVAYRGEDVALMSVMLPRTLPPQAQ